MKQKQNQPKTGRETAPLHRATIDQLREGAFNKISGCALNFTHAGWWVGVGGVRYRLQRLQFGLSHPSFIRFETIGAHGDRFAPRWWRKFNLVVQTLRGLGTCLCECAGASAYCTSRAHPCARGAACMH